MIIKTEVNQTQTLDAVLSPYASGGTNELTNSDTLIVHLKKNESSTSSSNEIYMYNPLAFSCNLEIYGSPGVKVRTHFMPNPSTDNNPNSKDYIFHVCGTEEKRLSVLVKDVEFFISGGLVNREEDSDNNNSAKGVSYFKFYLCDGVVFDNVKIRINHSGYVNNVDLRMCNNVEIKDCLLENYNHCKEGGILWLRGAMSNIFISGNTFKKYGNDEALAFWGDNLIEPEKNYNNYDNPEVLKENITVVNNLFIYDNNGGGYSDSGDTAVPETVDSCDRLIAFNDNNALPYESTSESTSESASESASENLSINYIWKNILFTKNRFEIRGLVRNVISSQITQNATLTNFVIDSNTISHKHSRTIDADKSEYCYDFCIKHNNGGSTNDAIIDADMTISRNYITAKENIAGNFMHSCLCLNGGNVKFHDNTVNSDNITLTAGSGLPTGIIGVSVGCFGGVVEMGNCRFSGLGLLARIADSAGITGEINLKFNSNSFDGTTYIYAHNTCSLTLEASKNILYAESADLLFKGVYTNLVCNLLSNTWHNSTSGSSTGYIFYNGNNAAASATLNMRNNLFTGYSTIVVPSSSNFSSTQSNTITLI